MAKNMALLENNKVINIISCSDTTVQTSTLIEYNNIPIQIGDIYENGLYYRDGKEVLTETDQLLLEKEDLLTTMGQMVEEVYESDISAIGI